MNKNSALSAFFIALLLLIFYQVILIFSPFAEIIFWAGLLSFTFYPMHKFFLKIFKGHENSAAFLATLCVLLLVVPLAVAIFWKLASQAVDFFQQVLDFVRDGRLQQFLRDVRSLPLLQNIEARVHRFDFLEEGLHDWLVYYAKNLGSLAVREVGMITKNFFAYTLSFILVFFLMFAFFRYGQQIYSFIYQAVPLHESDKRAIFKQIRETFAAVIRGQLLTGFAQAVLAGIIFYFLGFPMAVFLGAATFLASLIPVVGASAVWVPCAAYLFFTGQLMKAGILFLLGIFVISLVDNFLKPALIGEKTKLPYFLLFLGVLGGLKLYGFTGIFIAPVILSLFFSLVKIYREKYLPTH